MKGGKRKRASITSGITSSSMQRSTTFVEVDVTKKKSDSLEEAISVREPLAVPRGDSEAGDAGSIPQRYFSMHVP
jgi:hypothetical protein